MSERNHPSTFLCSDSTKASAPSKTSTTDPLLTLIPPESYPQEERSLPLTFAYPFMYEPHPVAKYACQQVRREVDQLSKERWTQHNFGIGSGSNVDGAVGKMFGVLVVKTTKQEIGYLKAYSGTIQGVTHAQDYGYCPMIYNRFDTSSFYHDEEAQLNAMNQQIETLDQDPELRQRRELLSAIEEKAALALTKAKQEQKKQKKERQQQRTEQMALLSPEAYQRLEQDLIQRSAAVQRRVKQVKAEGQEQVQQARDSLAELEDKITSLKKQRKTKSANLQNKLFDQYQFRNINGQTKSLLPIFSNTPLQRPPSGAGDCAAPKLFQYAFQREYTPIALAEFWWGKSPVDEIRKHNLYYPACRGKCQPILEHMLQGMDVEENPLDTVGVRRSNEHEEDLEVLYEDDCMVVVNKPSEMLSVPGRNQDHSVFSVLQNKYPNATGPLLVHRLDMSTSGILVAAKDKDSHKALQGQFVNRTIHKRYTALLDGTVDDTRDKKGKIELPLNGDYMNRPMQKVDWVNGKPALTHYEIVGEEEQGGGKLRTRIHFYPVTGRTHQLRVHAAHSKGLDVPIVGDDIYGQRDKELGLCLHAGFLELEHPVSKQRMTFTCKTPF